MNKNIIINIYKNPYFINQYVHQNIKLNRTPQTNIILPTKKVWNDICSNIKNSLRRKNDIICKGVINKLTKKYINTMDFIFILNKKDLTNENKWSMHSYALCKHQNINGILGIYLVLLCAISMGSIVLKTIEKFAKNTIVLDNNNISKKYSYIELYSLAYVINFYRKYGYRHLLECKRVNYEKKDINKLSTKYKNLYFENDSRIYEYQRDKNNQTIIKKNHPEYFEFIEKLIKEGFCEQVPKTNNVLDDYIIYNSFCLETGLMMRKCLLNKKTKKKIKKGII